MKMLRSADWLAFSSPATPLAKDTGPALSIVAA
jgi:hypothetical protein